MSRRATTVVMILVNQTWPHDIISRSAILISETTVSLARLFGIFYELPR